MNAPPPVVLTSTSPVVQGQQVLPVQQGMTSQPQVVVIQAPPSPQLEMGSSQQSCVVGMGATQLTIGILFLIVQIGAFILPTTVTLYAAPGTWGGIFFIIAGAFGITGGRKKSKGLVITFLVLSIISACVAIPAFIVAAISVSVDNDSYYYTDPDAAIAVDSVLLLLGLVELVIAIVSSGIGCGVLCCRNGGQRGNVFVQPQVAGVDHRQAAYPTQQWQQGPQPQTVYPTQQWQQGPSAPVAGPYQPQDPPPYSVHEEPFKHDLAGVHGVSATQPPSDVPPPYNPAIKQGMY